MKRILFIQKMAGISGSELYYLKLLPELRKKGIQCDFLCLYNRGNKIKNEDFVSRLTSHGIEVIELKAPRMLSIPFIFRLNSIIKKGAYDLVQSNLIHSDFWCALVKKFLNRKMKLVSVKHGYDETYQLNHGFDPEKIDKRDLYYRVARYSEKYMDRSASISHGLMHFFVQTGIADPNRIEVVPYGFDFSEVHYDSSEKQYRYSDSQLVLIGRLVPYKGHEHIISVMPEIRRVVKDAVLVIVGSGAHEEFLKQKVSEFRAEDGVRFEGFQTNIHDYLKGSDIALMTSKSEGFCAVILEAWHNKCPVVSFDVPAPNEIITHDETGLLVEAADRNSLKDAVISLLKDSDKRKALGEAGYRRLQAKYSSQEMVANTLAFYQKVSS